MYNEPDENPAEPPRDPVQRAKERFDEFRMHAELVAVFEGVRKFEAELIPTLDADLARTVQRTIAKLEKSKSADSPIIPPQSMDEAAQLLNFPATHDLTTNDYHIHRRPGEVMIVRWLAGDEVDTFYTRFQAHFDAALGQFRAEERQQNEWKQDPETLKYLEALDKIEVKMADRYLRDGIRKHKAFILSTQTADEIDIVHLTDYIMGVDPYQLVGSASAPPEEPTEQDRAWFFKLFSLRGVLEDVEQMCFFTFLQKTDDSFGDDIE
jgi:hypothetical protein